MVSKRDIRKLRARVRKKLEDEEYFLQLLQPLHNDITDDDDKRDPSNTYQANGTHHCVAGVQWLDQTEHDFTGEAFLCEECDEWHCRDHTQEDHMEERMKDGVFLCSRCRRFADAFADCM